ncbi:hypothetical protein T11_6198 [Trichinella zimbabwensis]|uniref:Uncharacterized protein n=1 Tax=Trichinella zimbabwensis TaxID=268475 RepID=A0A0V1DS05_9BILA|nr:hypothetical protein T11_6198 [Trichinella zimbabwensis]
MKLRNNCYLNKSLILAKNIGDSVEKIIKILHLHFFPNI